MERDRLDARGDNRRDVERTVGQLLKLCGDEAACALLGVEAVLAEQVDITFLDDPLDYVSYDIAAALVEAEEETGAAAPAMLSTLVGEIKLCQALGEHAGQHDLTERVLQHLREMQR